MTLLSFVIVEVLSMLSLFVAFYMLILSGTIHVPLQMRVIYRMAKEWLADKGWGEEIGAKREEYPNRREST